MSRFQIAKTFSFDASHQLAGLREGHKCARLHGHTYSVTLILERTELDEVGFVRDYGELGEFKRYLDEFVDHRHLNDVWPTVNPTAERIAQQLHGVARSLYPDLVTVRVSETPTTWAEYSE